MNYEKLQESCTKIKSYLKNSNLSDQPQIGLILGSGLGAFADKLEDKIIIPYDEIPHFHKTTVPGHIGRLVIGKIKNCTVAVLQGRLHAYEGHSMEDIVFPVRTLATLGIKTLILSNAAGGVNTNYKPGDLVIIKDHINLLGTNPLVGANNEKMGPRFPDMTYTYCSKIKKIIEDVSSELGQKLNSGVYAAMLGPTYETPAEVKMARILGADMVGMSTVPEAIAARHMGLQIAGISCITNMAAGINEVELDHSEIKEEADKVMNKFQSIIELTLEKISDSQNNI